MKTLHKLSRNRFSRKTEVVTGSPHHTKDMPTVANNIGSKRDWNNHIQGMSGEMDYGKIIAYIRKKSLYLEQPHTRYEW